MRMKQKAYCVGVVFVYTITAITAPSAGRPNYQTAKNGDDLTTKSEAGKPLQLSSKPGGGGGGLRGCSGGRPGHRKRTESSSLEGMFSPKANCSRGQVKHVVYGKFYITGHRKPNTLNKSMTEHRSDSAASVRAQGGQVRVRGQRLSGSGEPWQKLQPVVECGDHGMTLTVRKSRAVRLQLDRVNESSVPLSQLPPQCGYSVQKSWRDLSLMARYDACHVTQEGETYVLPLLWRGILAKMSCPVSQTEPQALGPSSLCCSPDGMTIKLQGLSALEELSVAVRGEWTTVTQLVEQCSYTLDRRDAQTVIAAPFITCGITVKDGKHTLSLQLGENVFTLACPVSPSEEQPTTHQPLGDSPPHQTTNPVLVSLEPLLWHPPFYLAPPYYPHPTYHHSYVTAESAGSLHPLLPVGSQPGYWDQYSHHIPEREQVYPDKNPNQQTPLIDLSERHIAAPTGFPAQAESTQFKPLSQDFSPYYHYYHYYHHPKIPLPGTHLDPDPGPDDSGELSEQPQSQFSALHPHSLPAHPAFPSPLHASYPYFYYFPHAVQGETKKQELLHPDRAAQTDLSSLHKRPRSPVPSVHSTNPNLNGPNTDVNSEGFLSDAVKSETAPRPERPSPSTPPFIYEPHPYQNYFQPYSEGCLCADKHASPSPARHQTAAPPTESTYGSQNGPPDYRYYHLHQPTGSRVEGESEPQLPSGGEGRFAHGAETQYPSMPLHDFYPYYISPWHLHDPFRRDDEKPDAETKVSDSVLGPPVQSSGDSNVPCMQRQQLTSDVDILIVPLDGINNDLSCQTAVNALEVEGIHPQQDGESAHESSRAGLVKESSSSSDSPDQTDQPPHPQIQPKPITLHLKIATGDESFSSFHPEPHLPLSLAQGRTLYVEVGLLDPPEPNLLLLVRSCWAYTGSPYGSWALVYDGCLSQSVSQLLPSPNSHHIRRIRVSSFLSFFPYTAPPEDPEIYFLCLVAVCSAADNDCVISCKGPNIDV
ncbi:uncharacterized protein LOC114439464 [Parambassis ranga]|uniref:Uncharacterized protein LOC114439464 n=1 Tax=Parambassis ranga TaxID=210632 RepID=A0A6P7IQ72_9TELE|nr:uncharacterized protein LOC114439464 [Parambassis ranga]